MLTYFLFAVGFVFLIKGADWLVDGSSSLARRFNVSEMAIGLTIVSIGTSAPELIVNVIASINGSSDIAIGNVFGSNIANVLLILGITAIIFPVPIRKDTIRTDIPFVLVATLLVAFLANAHLFLETEKLFITRIDGVILLLFFIIFMSYVFKMSKGNDSGPSEMPKLSVKKSALFIFLGIIGLFLGGKWVVEGAVEVARHFGMSEGFIGLTIVAVGTSLPELVTSVMAARKKSVDIAVGNVIGSNIFNLLWVIGLSSIINPLEFNTVNNTDVMVMLFSSTLIIIVISFNKRFTISRLSGLLFVVFYVLYIVFLFYRDIFLK